MLLHNFFDHSKVLPLHITQFLVMVIDKTDLVVIRYSLDFFDHVVLELEVMVGASTFGEHVVEVEVVDV